VNFLHGRRLDVRQLWTGDDCNATAALAAVELGDIWGISGGFTRRLNRLGIDKPLELREANPHFIRQHLGVVGERIVYELRGTSCIELEEITADKQNICCSRSFGQVTSDYNMIREATVTFASQACENCDGKSWWLQS